MSNVTEILSAIDSDPASAHALLPVVYEELRKLAVVKLAQERPGQTLQATALVHEAYLRLLGPSNQNGFANRGHFFAAAAEAMRRILIEQARRKRAQKNGGGIQRIELRESEIEAPQAGIDLLALDDAIEKLNSSDTRKAQLVKLRLFAGLTLHQAAQALGISDSTVDEDWAYAKAWLKVELQG